MSNQYCQNFCVPHIHKHPLVFLLEYIHKCPKDSSFCTTVKEPKYHLLGEIAH